MIDNDNGVSLEHLITCAQDVQIQYSEGCFKQLQWENDKSKPINVQARNLLNKNKPDASIKPDTAELNEFDELAEESQRKLNQFSHEVVDLFKSIHKCIIPLSRFNNEYHKKYGRQLRVADYGFSKLYDLLESIPHILQILDSEFEKKLTLTHRVQVRRFSNDLVKVLKSHATKQMFADEYPSAYQKYFAKSFDIRDYGVCYLEDMLAELPETIIGRKEIEGRTFIQIPKVFQMDEQRLCAHRFARDIIDMLKQKPRFAIQLSKFIPNFHQHFGRQCKLSNYGFVKLVDLFESLPNTVQLLNKDGVQFVQLRKELTLDIVCQNLIKLIEENGHKIKASLAKLEELYNSKFEHIYYQDLECDNFAQLFVKLPIEKNCIRCTSTLNDMDIFSFYRNQFRIDCEKLEWNIVVEQLNERELKRTCKLMLRKLMEDSDETVVGLINEHKFNHRNYYFSDLLEVLYYKNSQFTNFAKTFNKRSINFMVKYLSDFIQFNSDQEDYLVGFSELYYFAKEIRSLYIGSNVLDMTFSELESLYKETNKSSAVNQPVDDGQSYSSGFPYKRLGFIDNSSLFNQGLSMLITIKKLNDKRFCLNKEFWRKILHYFYFTMISFFVVVL